MMFNKLTFNLSLGILVIVAIYTLTYSGITGLLMSAAVGLLAAAFLDEVELIAVVTVVFAVLFTTFSKQILRKIESFQNQNDDILGRVHGMKNSYQQKPHDVRNPRLEPAGVYDPSVEGFANPDLHDSPKETPKEDGASSKSSSAPAKRNKEEVDDKEVKKISNNITQKFEDSSQQVQSDEFQSATNGLFKLGKMPSEHEAGPKLDAGKTIMKAMAGFDPSTISAMTEDTKKLLETQKGLMSMLNQMRPVLADGKELLNTFSGMFGNSGNNALLKM